MMKKVMMKKHYYKQKVMMKKHYYKQKVMMKIISNDEKTLL